MPKKFADILFEKEGAMGIKVGKLIGFLKDTACMNREEREIIGLLEYMKELFKNDKNFSKFIDQIVKPFFVKQGHAKWKRDVVTDLALAMSRRRERKEKSDQIIDFTPKDKQ